MKGSSSKKPGLVKMFKAFWITLVNPGAADDMTGKRKKNEEEPVKGKRLTAKRGKGRKLGS